MPAVIPWPPLRAGEVRRVAAVLALAGIAAVLSGCGAYEREKFAAQCAATPRSDYTCRSEPVPPVEQAKRECIGLMTSHSTNADTVQTLGAYFNDCMAARGYHPVPPQSEQSRQSAPAPSRVSVPPPPAVLVPGLNAPCGPYDIHNLSSLCYQFTNPSPPPPQSQPRTCTTQREGLGPAATWTTTCY